MDYLQYYGVDWLAMVLTFVAIWQIGNKNKIGFMLMMCGNTSWVFVGILTESVAMVIANIIFFSMNVRALLKWGKEAKANPESVV
ncbi:MAG: PnuC protein [Saccharospirillaceae bacterium]|nr:hypothetical protein [Pseudomonadales bacterium]NRB78124.1 PnuC protein [Saccharospirillaceae bacterium]